MPVKRFTDSEAAYPLKFALRHIDVDKALREAGGSTNPERLEVLSKHENDAVRRVVALNIFSSFDTLQELTHDPYVGASWNAKDTLKRKMQPLTDIQKIGVVRSSEVLDSLVGTTKITLLHMLVVNPHSTQHTIEKVVDRCDEVASTYDRLPILYTFEEAAENPKTNDAAKAKMYAVIQKMRKGGSLTPRQLELCEKVENLVKP